MTSYIAYVRTSTGSQHNGLDAQKEAIDGFIKLHGGTVIETYTEQVSVKKDNREEL